MEMGVQLPLGAPEPGVRFPGGSDEEVKGLKLAADRCMQLLNDGDIQERVKLEDYIAVAAGARRVSMLLVPADFPDAERMRQGMDEVYARRYYHSTRRSGGIASMFDRVRYGIMRAVMNPLRYRTSLLRESFEEVVLEHPNYKAHRKWADRMGLQVYEKQLRPSIDEMYLIRDSSVVSEVAALMVRRDEIRREMMEQMRQGDRMQPTLMPEEQSAEFLNRLGTLLGYPECCIEAYGQDIRNGVDSALRVSNQLAEYEGDVDADVFFAGTFFPCEPDCAHAAAVGASMAAAAAETDGSLERRMRRVFQGNVDYLARYPEILRRRREQMMSRYMGVSTDEER